MSKCTECGSKLIKKSNLFVCANCGLEHTEISEEENILSNTRTTEVIQVCECDAPIRFTKMYGVFFCRNCGILFVEKYKLSYSKTMLKTISDEIKSKNEFLAKVENWSKKTRIGYGKIGFQKMTKRRWVFRSSFGRLLFNSKILKEEEKLQNISIIFELLSSAQNGVPVPLEQIRYFYDFGELTEDENGRVKEIMMVEKEDWEEEDLERNDMILGIVEPNYCYGCSHYKEVSYFCESCNFTYCEECAESTSYECGCGPGHKIKKLY